jgi:hypothetical protein
MVMSIDDNMTMSVDNEGALISHSPNSTVFLVLFLSLMVSLFVLSIIQLIYDYQLCRSHRQRPPNLKIFIHYWQCIVSSCIASAYLTLALVDVPFIWRLLVYQCNCFSMELVMYWQWTVFGVARRTAGQSQLSATWSNVAILYSLCCHGVSIMNTVREDDMTQFITLSVMTWISVVATWIGYCPLSRQVSIVLTAQQTSQVHVNPAPILAALRRVRIMVGLISSVAIASLCITIMYALPSNMFDPRIVPILYALAWAGACPMMATFGWVQLPWRLRLCCYRCCPSITLSPPQLHHHSIRVAHSPISTGPNGGITIGSPTGAAAARGFPIPMGGAAAAVGGHAIGSEGPLSSHSSGQPRLQHHPSSYQYTSHAGGGGHLVSVSIFFFFLSNNLLSMSLVGWH